MNNPNRTGAADIPWADLHTFRDRVAIVTGGGSGIGKAAAARLAEAGAKVVVVDLDGAAAELVAKSLPDGSAVAVQADVATEQDTSAYVDAATSTFGRVDLFFSNAGVLGEAGPLLDASPGGWERTMGVNLLGTSFGLQAVARRMINQGDGGSIVVTASIAALRSSPGAAVYAASKAGVVNLVRGAAREWGPHGIRVNAICPAPTLTNFSTMPVDYVERARSGIPLGRLGEADDMARVALWLLSDGACFVNGAVLPVDGGSVA